MNMAASGERLSDTIRNYLQMLDYARVHENRTVVKGF